MKPVAASAFAARMASLSDVIGLVEEFARGHGIARDDLLRLTLVVEELFTNTVVHGHGGDSDALIRLALGATEAEVCLLYEDDAPPFDASAGVAEHASDPGDTGATGTDRRVGGLGLRLVAHHAARLRYAREEGRNRLWFVLRRET